MPRMRLKTHTEGVCEQDAAEKFEPKPLNYDHDGEKCMYSSPNKTMIQSKLNKISGTYKHSIRELRNAHKILVGKSEGKRPLAKL